MMINILITAIIAVNEITETNNNYWISFISLQFIKQYDDEDLMEIVLPRLARVMTVWEFVLMKVCLDIGTAKKKIEYEVHFFLVTYFEKWNFHIF